MHVRRPYDYTDFVEGVQYMFYIEGTLIYFDNDKGVRVNTNLSVVSPYTLLFQNMNQYH